MTCGGSDQPCGDGDGSIGGEAAVRLTDCGLAAVRTVCEMKKACLQLGLWLLRWHDPFHLQNRGK